MSEKKRDFILGDRIGEYLIPYLNDYLFDELSEDYLKRSDTLDILSKVPVPIKKTDLEDLTNLKIAHSMAMVMGCDVKFPHRESYIKYINKLFGDAFVPPLLNEGVELAAKGNPEEACICFRSALLIDPESSDALYCYGRACKDAYESGDGEEYVGRFKAEALEAFEKLTILAPKLEMGYYFLGYGYLNLGLYTKAKLTFEEFLKLAKKPPTEESSLSSDLMGEDITHSPERLEERALAIEDVEDWITRLEEPIKIEAGYNKILSGRYEEGIEILLPYTENKNYSDWWPLYYYLGVAYKEIGEKELAIENLLQVLKMSPSDIATMEELVDSYEELGDIENADKYRKKIKVIERNLEEERAEGNFS